MLVDKFSSSLEGLAGRCHQCRMTRHSRQRYCASQRLFYNYTALIIKKKALLIPVFIIEFRPLLTATFKSSFQVSGSSRPCPGPFDHGHRPPLDASGVKEEVTAALETFSADDELELVYDWMPLTDIADWETCNLRILSD